jgi:hypothetical protein
MAKRTLILIDNTLKLDNPVVRALGTTLGPGRVIPVSAGSMPAGFERNILVGGQDAGSQLYDFYKPRSAQFFGKPFGLVCLSDRPEDQTWLPEIKASIGNRVTHSAVISPNNASAAIDFAINFRQADHAPSTAMSYTELKSYIEKFLLAHNSCALGTSYKGKVHITPLEYRYQSRHIYFISEGGEKFAGLLDNNQVSIAIYDSFRGFDNIGGMQLTGTASVSPLFSNIYFRILSMWGINLEKLKGMSALLYTIDVQLEEAIFLWSGFKKYEYETRQVFHFERDSQSTSQMMPAVKD